MKIETIQIDWNKSDNIPRLHSISGNEGAKRAIEVCLAGGHAIAIMSVVRSPAADLLRSAARVAKENRIPFKGFVVPACPCGAYGSPAEECQCRMKEIEKHLLKVAPILRAADIGVETVEPRARDTTKGNEHEESIVERIMEVHARNDAGLRPLDMGAEELLRAAIVEIRVNREKVIAVANTIARMDHRDMIQNMHVAEACQYQRINRWFDGFESLEVKP